MALSEIESDAEKVYLIFSALLTSEFTSSSVVTIARISFVSFSTFTLTVEESVSLPSVTVNVAVYVPSALYE